MLKNGLEKGLEKGYVQVYTGNGKGKTTAMLGLALRACGAGLRVYIGQFIKSEAFNEVKALQQLPNIDIEQYGAGGLILAGATMDDAQAAAAGMKKATEALLCGKYDMVALDEINMAVLLGLVSVEDVLTLIEKKPHSVELVLTGRFAHPDIVAAADLVSEIRDVKHYYNAGVPARDGIEQ